MRMVFRESLISICVVMAEFLLALSSFFLEDSIIAGQGKAKRSASVTLPFFSRPLHAIDVNGQQYPLTLASHSFDRTLMRNLNIYPS